MAGTYKLSLQLTVKTRRNWKSFSFLLCKWISWWFCVRNWTWILFFPLLSVISFKKVGLHVDIGSSDLYGRILSIRRGKSAVVQGSHLSCISRGAFLATQQNFDSFQCSWERCGCLWWARIYLDPRMQSYLHLTSQYLHGSACATQSQMLRLSKWTVFKNILSVLSYAIFPVSVKCPREHKHSWH